MTDVQHLLPEASRRRLEALMLVPQHIRAGAMKGERRSVRRGTSIEFADYRDYTPGDDLRRLDWNVYARLDKPYIKLLEDEEDLAVHVLLDASGSMDWPPAADDRPGAHKFLFAQRLAAAVGYIALRNQDRLNVAPLDERAGFGPVRGRGQTLRLLHYLHSLSAAGTTDLNAALRRYALREKRPGLLFFISDVLAPAGALEGLQALLAKGHEVALLHVLSPDELEPPLAGDLRLIDVETGQPQEVTIDATLRGLYQQRLAAWLHDLRDGCARRGVHYLQVTTDSPFEKVLLYDLRRAGLVK
ncbi:MAG: DUF58 domain-containing protein [Anaerolineae bacterium]|nr:DUF58 domain-containing protein [Anaerolineae bacterium]